jgi:bacillolysin
MPSPRAFVDVLGALIILLTVGTGAQAQSLPNSRTLRLGSQSDLAAIREADAAIETLRREGNLTLRARTVDAQVAGRTHERLVQRHRGVPVFGAEITRQTDQGMTVSLFGTLYDRLTLETTPTLSPTAAAQVFDDLAGSGRRLTEPRLLVLPTRAAVGDSRLVYEARVFTGARLMAYFIDAGSGEVVWSYNDLKTQQPTLPCQQCTVGEGLGVKGDRKKLSVTTVGGAFLAHDRLRPADVYTFDLRGDWVRTLAVLNGSTQLFDADLAADADNDWLDGASVDAHVGMGWTYDYLFSRFERQGLNAENVRMISLVHPIDRSDVFTAPPELVGLFNLNAFYCGLCGPDGVGVAVFGEGLPPNLLLGGKRIGYFSGALDVVAHELAHAVTDFTSALIPLDESGALNEAFSDIIGVEVEHYAEPFFRDGAGRADYLLGEDVIEPGGIRSLPNPQQFGDPDHYSLRFLGLDDNGGIHTNSLIATHAYYLAIEGGTNRVSGLDVTGVGAANREQMEQIFFRAFTQFLTPLSTFADARAATIQAARDIYGVGSTPEAAVIQAWDAVGVQ